MKNIIPKRIKELRNIYKLTQQQLADKLGLKKSTIGSWESGKNNPELQALENICNLFGVSFSYFYDEDYRDKLNPYAVVIADAQAKHISAEQLEALISVLYKQQ